MRRVLFACVGNSLRSQMAEGFARHLARPGTVEARSGGTAPAGFVHPKAVRAMQERGIDIGHHTSKTLDLDFARHADAFITLCGPLDDACPRAVAERAIDWSLPDPAGADDATVRRIRDVIEEKVRRLLEEWGVLRDDVHVRA